MHKVSNIEYHSTQTIIALRSFCLTISLSLIDPVHNGGMKDTTLVGNIPTNNLTVFQCLL